jgi:hypothetical protein
MYLARRLRSCFDLTWYGVVILSTTSRICTPPTVKLVSNCSKDPTSVLSIRFLPFRENGTARYCKPRKNSTHQPLTDYTN